MDGTGALQRWLPSVKVIGYLCAWDGHLRGWAPLHSMPNKPQRSALQVFSQERPFSRIPSLLVPGLVFAGQRPSRPPNREILGLSEDVWILAEKCWDENPNFRPHVADILFFFEAASCHWASKAISNLCLGLPITAQESPTRETTFTASEAMSGTGSGDRDVVPNPHSACGSISSPMPNEQ